MVEPAPVVVEEPAADAAAEGEAAPEAEAAEAGQEPAADADAAATTPAATTPAATTAAAAEPVLTAAEKKAAAIAAGLKVYKPIPFTCYESAYKLASSISALGMTTYMLF